jgi:nucleoside-diphosphate kinase
LIGEIISRLEQRGLKLVAARFVTVDMQLAEAHYAIHKGKPFYEGLIKYITSSPVMAMAWEGPNVIAAVRQMVGATNPTAAMPGTIRHDLAIQTGRNLVHASDSPENAEAEIALWFKPGEIVEWKRSLDSWLFENN